MKLYTLDKMGVLGLLVAVAFFIPLPFNSIYALFAEETTITEATIPTGQEGLEPGQVQSEPQTPEYVPGEVLVKFKEGAEPEVVLEEVNIRATSIERTHSIKPPVNEFRKTYKLEKDSDGWYWFFGKMYKDVEEISDEDLFEEAYKEMSPLRQGLYRNYRLILSEGESVEDAVEKLRNNPNIEYVYPNYIREISAIPTDPRFSQQWGLHNIRQSGGILDADIDAPEAWDITEGERDIIIAIIDTGVDYNHEDLFANIWVNPAIVVDRNSDDIIDTRDLDLDGSGTIEEAELNQYGEGQDVIGYDFVSVSADDVYFGEDYDPPDNDPMDFHYHGTHCSGIAAAVKDNLIGIAGVAPNCRIMAIRAGYAATDGRGYLEDSDIEQAILYAADNGARVINMSFEGDECGAFEDEIKTAHDEDIVLVAAAGNLGRDFFWLLLEYPVYPAAMDEVIAVAATDVSDNSAIFSCYGDWVDIAAPGVYILSSVPDNRYDLLNGTSMACPHVAGLAALLLSKYPTLPNEEVRRIIQLTSEDLGQPGRDRYFGYGRINAHRAALYVEALMFSPPGIRYYWPRQLTLSVSEGSLVRFYLWAYDPDGDPLTFTWKLDGVPQTYSCQWEGERWRGEMWVYKTDYNSAGKHSIVCEVSDGINRPVSIKWSITIPDVDTGYGYGN